MATNTGNSSNLQRIAIRCSCGKPLVALPRQAGKRVKCPACGQAVVVPAMASPQTVRVAPQVEDESQGMSRKTLIALWSFVGVFTIVCACVVFLAWHSYSSHRAKIVAANDRVSKAVSAANEWMASKSFVGYEAVEQELIDAIADANATEKQDGDSVLNQVRERRAEIEVAVEKRQKAERLATIERHRQEEQRKAQDEERRQAQEEEQKRAQEEERRRANEPFDLKGDRLGMSLEAFKAKYTRTVKGHDEKAPFCSDTRPGKEISTLLSEPWHTGAGIVNCSIAFPFEAY
jgi:hypothetical protein